MKTNIIYIGLFSLIALFFNSCSSELDNVYPKDRIPQSELTENDIAKLRIGMYAQMENTLFAYAFDFDVRGENFKAGPGFSLIDPVNMSAPDPKIQGLWQSAFIVLSKVNFVIETIDGVSNPTTGMQQIKGEALFCRALIYYNMVTRWGGVPIMLKRSYDNEQRSSENDVWAQIKADLSAAETLVGNFTDRFYISNSAIDAFSARVYLATGDKQKAISYADKVISSGKFTLAKTSEEYATMFIANSNSKELIFSLANNSPSNKHLYYQQVNDVDPTWDYSPADPMYNNLYADYALASGDKRKSAVFSGDNSRIIKFPNGKNGQQLVATTNSDYTPINVFRISEMHLIKAEALGAGQEAENQLISYFENRYTTPPAAGAIKSLGAKDFQDMILNERRREFYGEGQWWYDVKRTGRTDLLTSLAGRDYLMYYPIPEKEKDLAEYTQNPGY